MSGLWDIAMVVTTGWLLARSFPSPAGSPRPTSSPTDEGTGPTPLAQPTASVGPATSGARDASSALPAAPAQTPTLSLEEALRRELQAVRDRRVAASVKAGATPVAPDRASPVSWSSPLYGVAGLRLAPPPPPGSETPAQLLSRLGDVPGSPIYSEDPNDWEDMEVSPGEVVRMPRGMQAWGERAYAAFHLRKAFHRVK